jgi:hypothetical protein
MSRPQTKHYRTVRTVSEAIDALGGNTAFAEFAGVNRNLVADWKIRGQLPKWRYLPLTAALLKKEGIILSPLAFGMEEVTYE